MGGPLLSWLPALAYRGATDDDHPVKTTLLTCTIVWYLALIGTTRHLHLWSGWDPSGHLVVYGSQLAPLYQLFFDGASSSSHAASELRDGVSALLLLWLVSWAAVLGYLSCMTALAFHTLSETLAAAALVLVLIIWLHNSAVDPRTGSIERWHVEVAVGMWALPTALSWAMHATPRGLLSGMLAYDLAVWVCLLALTLREAHGQRAAFVGSRSLCRLMS